LVNGSAVSPTVSAASFCPLGELCETLRDTDEAVPRLHQALRVGPESPRPHSDLGVLLTRRGRLDAALPHLRRAVELAPQTPAWHNNLGIALARAGRLDDALAEYREALRLQPGSSQAHYNLGNALAQAGRREEAAGHLEAALAAKPADFETRFRLGMVRLAQGQVEQAVRHLREARRIRPASVEALNQLGVALLQLEKAEEAAGCLAEAVRLRPNAAGLRNNHGIALARLGRFADALEQYREALRLEPAAPGTLGNLANALRDSGRLEEAILCYDEVLRRTPRAADVHNNAGIACVKARRLGRARSHYDEALRLQPGFPEARLNRAHLRLLEGDFAGGWPDYECRWRMRQAQPLRTGKPAWDGSPLAGRTILLTWEQGFGDTLQLVRLVPLVKQQGGTVFLSCQPRLYELLSRCKGFDRLLRHGEPLPDFDVHAPLASLPRLLGVTAENIPAEVPYLFANPELVEHWRRELPAGEALKVGIAWQGNPRYGGDRHRSIPLLYFLPLARLAGVQLYSLQKGEGAEQLRALGPGTGVLDLAARLDEGGSAFVDTAAAMMNLDLVVTSDTSVAHLAGGLGVPVWLALNYCSDWRWLQDRPDSPWYPTMRLFRQERFGDWAGVFARLAEALQEAEGRRRLRRLRAPVSVGRLIDRITVLMVRRQRPAPAGERQHVWEELAALVNTLDRTVPPVEELTQLTEELRCANEILLDAREAVRQCEKRQEFGPVYVTLARRIFQTQERRVALRRLIDERTGSALREQWPDGPDGEPVAAPGEAAPAAGQQEMAPSG
jgi:Flp pilus assembly protein TadD